jgi:hypothetical protein
MKGDVCGHVSLTIPLIRYRSGTLREVRCMRPANHSRLHKGVKAQPRDTSSFYAFVWEECEEGTGLKSWIQYSTREKQRINALPIAER